MAENFISVMVFASTQQITILQKKFSFFSKVYFEVNNCSLVNNICMNSKRTHLSVCDSVMECLAGTGRLD